MIYSLCHILSEICGSKEIISDTKIIKPEVLKIVINGRYTDAVVYGNIIEECAVDQITDLCDHPAFEGASVRIMPDCHAGKGCVIGFTSVSDRRIVIPNIVGVDIGCGILATEFSADTEMNYKEIDSFIRETIPSSTDVRTSVDPRVSADSEFLDKLSGVCETVNAADNMEYYLFSLGTLGGGNHFIEIDRIADSRYMLFVHTGSRNFGNRICRYFQNHAAVYDDEKRRDILSKHRNARTPEEHAAIDLEAAQLPEVSREFAFLKNELYDSYINCMIFAKEYAALNRVLISDAIIGFLVNNYGITVRDRFDTIHNYIDWYDDTHSTVVIRKGAVSANEGERLVIPLNMRDGVIIAEGKGDPEWNNSAPHGAGRILSRSEARKSISFSDYENVMTGINTWSVCEETIDEAPQAYKPAEEIINSIGDTVSVLEIAKPVYNFKAS